MADDIGHFKVVLEAEIDRDIGKSLEEGFEKSSEKIGRNLQKEIEESIDKSVEKARKFEKSFKIPSFGQIGEKLTSFLGQSTKSAVAGGLAAGSGSTEAASGSGIMAIVGKLSIVIGILALVYDVIKSLAPVVAIFKLISAMLQLTLYPIAQFLLTIFKPILAIILKMFIIPWYTTWGPALAKFFAPSKDTNTIAGKPIWQILAELATSFGILDAIINGLIINIKLFIQGLKDLVNFILNGVIINIRLFIQNLINLKDTLISTITWIRNNWGNITNVILSPLQSVWNFINSIRLPPWLGGGGGGGNVPSLPTIPTSPPPTTSTPMPWDIIKMPWQRLAEGGIVNSPTVSLIGERGPEAVIPLNKLSGMSNVNLTINIAKVEKSVDVNDIINKIERTLYTNMKRAGAR